MTIIIACFLLDWWQVLFLVTPCHILLKLGRDLCLRYYVKTCTMYGGIYARTVHGRHQILIPFLVKN
jgi:hypothetical protein